MSSNTPLYIFLFEVETFADVVDSLKDLHHVPNLIEKNFVITNLQGHSYLKIYLYIFIDTVCAG